MAKLFLLLFYLCFLFTTDSLVALEKHKMNLEDRYDRLKDYCFSMRLSAYSCQIKPLKNNDKIRDHYYRERGGEVVITNTERTLSALARTAQAIGRSLSRKTNSSSLANNALNRLTMDIKEIKNKQNLSDCHVSCLAQCASKGLVSLASTIFEFPYLFATTETILENGVGVCYNIAAIYTSLMNKLGYKSQVRASKENIHYYSEVELNGDMLIVDPTYSTDVSGGDCLFFSDSIKDKNKLYSAPIDLVEKLFKNNLNYIADNRITTEELKVQLERKKYIVIKGVNDLDDFNKIFDREFEKRKIESKWVKNDEDRKKLKAIYDEMKIKDDDQNQYAKKKYQFIQKSYFTVATKGSYRYFLIVPGALNNLVK